MIELVLLAAVAVVALLATRAYNRRHALQYREKRAQHFLLDVNLPSTCSVLGDHSLSDFGCDYCDEVVVCNAYWNKGREFLDLSGPGEGFHFMDFDDPRLLRLVSTQDLGSTDRGYALLDPSRKDPKARTYDRRAKKLPASRFDLAAHVQYHTEYGKQAKEAASQDRSRSERFGAEPHSARRASALRGGQALADEYSRSFEAPGHR